MLPQEMLQNRSSVHSHMISWRTDRCQRWSRKLCHIDIIKAYDGNILRNTDPVFGKGFDRTKSDRIACCKDRRRQLAAVNQIACHLITGRNLEDTLLDIRLINQIVCITVINKDFFSVIRRFIPIFETISAPRRPLHVMIEKKCRHTREDKKGQSPHAPDSGNLARKLLFEEINLLSSSYPSCRQVVPAP